MKNITFLIATFCLTSINLNAQILSVSPAFPTVDDNLTIIYDASQGNGALAGSTTIYAHTGVITTASTSPTNWLFTQGTWGTADASVLMTSLGNNLFSLTIDMDVFYGFPGGTVVTDLAFVFRNANGSVVGRSADGTDIYYPVFQNNGELFAEIFEPSSSTSLLNLNDQLSIHAETNLYADLSIFDNGVLLNQTPNTTILDYNLTATTSGNHLVEFVADNGTFIKRDTIYYVVNPTLTVLDPPAGTKNGINYLSDTSVILQLYAPDKNNIYVKGNFNNWLVDVDYHMNRATDNATWWIEINNLTAGQKYGYQYFIDGAITVADPLSTLVLDPNNDNSISYATYPPTERLAYPTGLTTGWVSVMQPGAPQYTWQNTNFTAPANKDLIIYELLVRDFLAARNFKTLIDTLDYLDNLGINAIELMPISEFEGNESWGYNPAFHMALDKYYGTPNVFKSFVDSCHARGIAVIMDIALNHVFGSSPMVNMYWDGVNNRPAANSPWFNAICPHEPYCWGYDYNHEGQATKDYIDQINKYWLEEFHIDGYRFDYTKGFVNNGNGYSDTRIAILKRMADIIWASHPGAYIILEHWCDNAEEEQLSDYGMMLWGNLTYNYAQGNMGFTGNSNLSSGTHVGRGWTDPHLVSYMESHDEERLMYETLTYGSTSNPMHNARDLNTALTRAQASAVLFLTTPGPKMIWQFGELGYDISIDDPCRVCNKPVLWNYFQVSKRKQLYQIYAATLNLRNNYPTFQSLDFQYSLNGPVKRLNLNHTSMDAVVIANFAVTGLTGNPTFQNTGLWFEYFTGDTLNVTATTQSINLNPGEYRIYTTSKLPQPEILSTLSFEELIQNKFELSIFPVPANDNLNLKFESKTSQTVSYKIIDLNGQVVLTKSNLKVNNGSNNFDVNIQNLEKGNYVLLLETEKGFAHKEFIKM